MHLGPYEERRRLLQLIVILLCTIVAVCDSSLDCLSRLAHGALDIVCSSWSSFTHVIGIGYDLFLALSLIILARISISLKFAALLDKSSKVLNRSRARVSNWVILGASREQFDGGESLNLIWNIIRGSIYLRNSNLLIEIGIGGIEGG